MNASPENRGNKTRMAAGPRLPSAKVRSGAAGSPRVNAPAGASAGDATTSRRRQQHNTAGAPYYRGLLWDF